ncbi:MAG: hypothetical protein QUS08_02925 [Methanothrix sp.]|nr:hypothetical protein [Methanothrix sp.]
MDPIFAFLISMALVSLLIPRLGPFLSLLLSAISFGLMMGMEGELVGLISEGLGRIFSSLALVVFSGAVLAEYLRETGATRRIVADILGVTRSGLLVSGIAGYVICLPVMCSLTAYMVLEPVVSDLGRRTEGSGRRALFMAAAGSLVSFNLVYPSPVMVSLAGALRLEPYDLLVMGLYLSAPLLLLSYLFMKHLHVELEERPKEDLAPLAGRVSSWLPPLLPLALILLGLMLGEAPIWADPGIALLLGALLGLTLRREGVQGMVSAASRRAGVIMLDLCGAGAFGYVVGTSSLGTEIYSRGQVLPILLLPFLVSSALQLAQGSRVVTVVVASQILAGYPVDAMTLAFIIGAGAFMLSYVSDPYFWLIKRSTGASMREMVLGYTLPLSLLGLAAFIIVAMLYRIR